MYMRQALDVAENALQLGEVPVGCVIVLNEHPVLPRGESVVISHGANQVNATRDATRHAELVAIDRLLTGSASTDELRMPPSTKIKGASVGKVVPESICRARQQLWDDRWVSVKEDLTHWKNSFGWRNTGNSRLSTVDIFRGCTLYVTCEPCIQCAAALATVGIKRVVFGCKNDRFGGCGSLLQLHRTEVDDGIEKFGKSAGYEITAGVMEEEAVKLLRSFYDRENFHAPDEKRKKKDKIYE